MDSNDPTQNRGDLRPKRRRITRACNFCRRKKLRCDGGEPRCSTCEMHKQACDYTQPNRKRGVPAGQFQLLTRYRSLAEHVLGGLVSEMPGVGSAVEGFIHDLNAEKEEGEDRRLGFQVAWRRSDAYTAFEKFVTESDTMSTDMIPSDYPTSPDSEMQRRCSAQQAADSIEGRNQEQSTYRNSKTQSSISCLPIALCDALRPSHDDIHAAIPPMSVRAEPVAPQLQQPHHTSELPQVELLTSCPFYSPINSEVISELNYRPTVIPGAGTTLTDDCQFPSDAAELLEQYFTTVHSSVPLLDKIGVLYCFHNDNDTLLANEKLPRPISEKRAIIWSMCALVVPESHTSHDTILKQSRIYSRYFLSKTRLDFACTTDRVQALLLYTTDLVRASAWTTAREAMTLLCDVVSRGGFFPASPEETTEASASTVTADKGAKRKMWASCILFDTLIASVLHVLPIIQSHNCEVPLILEDNWEEWDTWVFHAVSAIRMSPGRISSTFNELTRLARGFNTFLTTSTFYGVDSGAKKAGKCAAIANAYRTFTTTAQEWAGNLPKHLNKALMWSKDGFSADTAPRTLPSYIIVLNIAYHAFNTFACRRVLGNEPSSTVCRTQISDIDIVTHRLDVSSACVDELAVLFKSTYGSLDKHPFVNAFLQLAGSDSSRAGSTIINQIPRTTLAPSAPHIRGLDLLGSSGMTLPNQVNDNMRQLPSWFGGVTRAPKGGQELSTTSEARTTGVGITAGDTVSSIDDLDMPLFEGSAEMSSLGLLDYPGNDPAQLMSFMDRLGFVRQDAGGVQLSQPQRQQSSEIEPAGTSQSIGMDIDNFQTILDDWMLGAADL